nr:AP2-like ethylene-responsive transcription factor ANT [Coffea arabica]
MKSVNDNNNGNDASSNNNCNAPNWLGFSLSPYMKMEVTSSSSSSEHHHHQFNHQNQPPPTSTSTDVPTSFCLSSPPHLNNIASPVCFGVSENGGFHHAPLSVMPIRSDGSLCIMEALRRSQTEAMGPNSSPKLENFFGGATMGTHQYGSQDRETMVLSLDSIFYSQNVEPEGEPIRQENPYFSGLQCQDMYQHPLHEENDETRVADCDTQIPTMAGEDLKNWVAVDYSDQHALDQQQLNTAPMVEGGNGSGSGSVGSVGCGDLQSLSLSMSPGSQSSCVTAPRHISPTEAECLAIETKKRSCGKVAQKQPVHRKSIDTFGQRTSQYRGVTRHRWTGRYEAHLWDNSCKKEGQTRKGRQVYLGGYDMEEKAARAYDLAALKYWGPSTHINFPLENYQQELEGMKNMSRQEYVAHLRRKSSGFSRGASIYRGVTRHHQHGRWQARIGRVAGNKDLYLGTFSTQEEAAEAYDIAAIKFRGVNAVTNFDISRYDVERIMASNTLPAGELARRNKETEPNNETIAYANAAHKSEECFQPERNANVSDWKMAPYQPPQQQQNLPMDSFNEKIMNVVHYQNPSYSTALHGLIGIDSGNSSRGIVDESAKLGAHFSNSSSLVTSLNSSREASPDRSGTSMLFAAKPTSAANYVNPTANVGSWIPSAQLKPVPISMAHLPVFAAWGDI